MGTPAGTTGRETGATTDTGYIGTPVGTTTTTTTGTSTDTGYVGTPLSRSQGATG
jgi:hypothetical protein